MATVRVSVDATGSIRALDVADKQVRYAAMLALNKTAQIGQKAVLQEMRTRLDRPTQFALDATTVVFAKREKLTAQVWLKGRHGGPASARNPSWAYPLVFGGRRGRKAMETALMRAGGLRSNEYLVPADGAPLDAHGNVPVGMIRQILAQLRAAERSAGYQANVRRGEKQTAQSKARQLKAGTFFIPKPGGGLPRGVYQRLAIGASRRTKAVQFRGKTKRVARSVWATRMIFKIVVGRPRYGIRLPMGEIVRRVVRQYFDREFSTAYAHALATAR